MIRATQCRDMRDGYIHREGGPDGGPYVPLRLVNRYAHNAAAALAEGLACFIVGPSERCHALPPAGVTRAELVLALDGAEQEVY